MDGTDEYIFEWPPELSETEALQAGVKALEEKAVKSWCGTCAVYFQTAADILRRIKDERRDSRTTLESPPTSNS